MGHDAETSGCAIRISIGPDTGREAVLRFAEAWGRARARHMARHG
jgi:cysteine desulfurase